MDPRDTHCQSGRSEPALLNFALPDKALPGHQLLGLQRRVVRQAVLP